jgi:dienelactone hydrolase
MSRIRFILPYLTVGLLFPLRSLAQEPLPGTAPLDWQGDIASRLVDTAGAFLDAAIVEAGAGREKFWQRDTTSAEAYVQSIATNRARFAKMTGVRDPRLPARLERLGVIAETANFTVTNVRWDVFTQVHGEGLLLEPRGAVVADAVVIPDAGETPEQECGLDTGVPTECHWARHLANQGVRVLVPLLINRDVTHRKLTNREFLYRPAFELGRHLIGYEVQKVLAGIDWLKSSQPEGAGRLVGVSGFGEGGLIALYAGALDQRIDVTAVSGYFGPRDGVWKELADRNVFGLLEQFGDAEIASLIAPRALVIEPVPGKEVTVPPGTGGKPGTLSGPAKEDSLAELERARKLVAGLAHAPMSAGGFPDFVQQLGVTVAGELQTPVPAFDVHASIDAPARHARQMEELDRHNQWLLRESPYARQDFFWSKLDTSSVEAYEKSLVPMRDYFRKEVVGQFDNPLVDPAPRTRVLKETETLTYYEVVLDVYDQADYFAYGILIVPKGLAEGQSLPCVVCQHGLEGRPQDVIGEPSFHYYQAFATELAEQGYITFAPQHLYIFEDRFRELQFKANALGKTLFSLMVPQHQQLVKWLGAQPFVDADRIGFYGLSYGGKSAMRIPPLVPEYKLSICSADFNEWVWKNASTRSPYSYVWTGEYEIFEFDLGSTFNYAEMAALIAPRPFMVERGHFDGVAPDEMVAHEFAKVRHLYNAKLKLPGRAEIEWFDGPHRINGQGTFEFLRRFLSLP